jgi:hypothetical protein
MMYIFNSISPLNKLLISNMLSLSTLYHAGYIEHSYFKIGLAYASPILYVGYHTIGYIGYNIFKNIFKNII